MGQTPSIAIKEKDMEHPCVRVALYAHGRLDGGDRSFVLTKSNPFLDVGRASSHSSRTNSASDHNCYINSPILSRYHARFVLGGEDAPLKIVDRGSTHGTFVDSLRLKEGQESPLKNGAIVTFGSEIRNGSTDYLPTSFAISFMFHNQTPASDAPVQKPVVIRCPSTPRDTSSDSEDVEELSTKKDTVKPSSTKTTSTQRQQLIELSRLCEPIGARSSGTCSQEPIIIDQDNDDLEADHRHSEGPEELSIIKETNVEGNIGTYGLYYEESDLEEDQDTTSQSSQPKGEMGSAIDVDGISNAVDPSQASTHTNQHENVVAENPTISGGNLKSLLCSEIEPSSRMDQDNREPFNILNSLNKQELAMRYEKDPEGEESSSVVSSEPDETHINYLEALKFFGLKSDVDKHVIIAKYEDMKRDGFEDTEKAKQCLTHICDWLDNDDLLDLLFDLEHEYSESEQDFLSDEELNAEDVDEEDCSDGEQVELDAVDMQIQDIPLQPAPLPSGHLPCPPIAVVETNNASNINNVIEPLPGCSTFDCPPISRYHHNQPASFDHRATTSAEIQSLPAQKTPVALKSSSSSKMQISSLLDDAIPPSQSLLDAARDHQALLDDVSLASITESKVAELNEISKEVLEEELPYIGRKRRFDEMESDVDLAEKTEIAPVEGLVWEPFDSLFSNVVASAESAASNYEDKTASRMVQNDSAEAIRPEDGGPSSSKKPRLGPASSNRSSRFKSFATHCLAGAVGAIGVVAAIVATTPVQVQEELYWTM